MGMCHSTFSQLPHKVYTHYIYLQKYNKSTNYVKLAVFDDKKLTVMPVPVTEVNNSDVMINLRLANTRTVCRTGCIQIAADLKWQLFLNTFM